MTITLNEATESLYSMLETAVYNYEIDVMVEEGEGETANADMAAKKDSKFKSLLELAKKAFAKIWELIRNAFGAIVAKIESWRKAVTIEEDMSVYPGFMNYDGKLGMYALTLMHGYNKNFEEIQKYLDGYQKSVNISKGTVLHNDKLTAIGKKYAATAEKLNKEASKLDAKTSEDITSAKELMNRISGIMNSIVSDYKKVNDMYAKQDQEKVADLIGQKKEKHEAKADKKFAKENAKAHAQAVKDRVSNESVDFSELAGRILVESARLLNESDDIIPDDAEQKAIDDIPEETPTKDDEYPADDVTGGEGIDCDKAIMDVLDGDKEAYKIATDDDGSTVTESVIITF